MEYFRVFVNWNKNERRGNYTIKVIITNVRKYLFHLGIKTNDQDIKEYLSIGKRTKEERYPSENERNNSRTGLESSEN